MSSMLKSKVKIQINLIYMLFLGHLSNKSFKVQSMKVGIITCVVPRGGIFQ